MSRVPARYTLDNAAPQTERRFDELEAMFDVPTIEYLSALGVAPGWACWEIGAGSGSIARWLAGAVGQTGSVLATDLDLRWLRDDGTPGLRASVHDVVRDEAPPEAFNLIHARLVLVHLRERERLLESLARSLRPGGWILIEDFDQTFFDATEAATDREQRIRTVQRAFAELLRRRGADLKYARRLPELLRRQGLRDVAGQGRIAFAAGGSPGSRLLKANFAQVADELIDGGLCTRADLNAALQALDDPRCGVSMSMLISVWGRRSQAVRT
jgi:precorrin-6B methylase 2